MPTYTWKIQFSEDYSDKFQQKGSIEKEKAVEEFQLFPWDKEIDDFKRRDDNPTVPKIIFNSDDQRQLIIETTNIKGYSVEYSNFVTNKFSDFYLSNNFEAKNFTAEEIIEFFFDNNIEPHIKLKDIPKEEKQLDEAAEKKKPKFTEFNYNPKHLKTIGFLPFIPIIGSIALLTVEKLKELGIFFHLFLLCTWLPVFVLHLTYIIKNAGAKILIDTQNHELTYIKGSKEIKFSRDNIDYCQVTFGHSMKGVFFDNYSYVWFILKDKTHVVITCFVADPSLIAETLNCKFTEKLRSMPFLPL